MTSLFIPIVLRALALPLVRYTKLTDLARVDHQECFLDFCDIYTVVPYKARFLYGLGAGDLKKMEKFGLKTLRFSLLPYRNIIQ